jgi:hypothetical protein
MKEVLIKIGREFEMTCKSQNESEDAFLAKTGNGQKRIHWSSVKVEVSFSLSILYNLNILNSHDGTSVTRYS